MKFISHLDMMRLWVRSFRRAGIPLLYSDGFSPHPKISLAVPLSVGLAGEAELMDVSVSKAISPHWFKSAVNQQLPPGVEVLDVYPVASSVASLQSQVRFAFYHVIIPTTKTGDEIRADVARFLKRETIPWHHERDTGRREYDLRALIEDITVLATGDEKCTIEMKLRCDEKGSGRPEQVVYALGFNAYPESITRTQLVLGHSC